MSQFDPKIFTNEQFKELKASLDKSAPLKDGGPGGTSGGMDDSGRLSQIETRLGNIEAEQRTHLRWVVTLFVAIVGAILASTSFLMLRVDRVEDRLARIDSNVNDLPSKMFSSLNQINSTLFQAISASKPVVILQPQPVQQPKQ